MNIQFHFTNTTDALKEDIKEYGTKRFLRLEKYITSFPDDNKMLSVKIEYFERHNAFKVTCTLQLGGKTIHHEETKHDPKETIDLVEANLISQTKKYVDQLRGKNNKRNSKNDDEEIEVNYDNI